MKTNKFKQFIVYSFSVMLVVLVGCNTPTPPAAPIPIPITANEPTAAAFQFQLTADQLPVEVTQGNNPATALTKGQTIAISPNDKIAVGAGGLGKLLYSDRVTVEILQGTELVMGSVTSVAGDRIEVSLIENFGHIHITIGENAKASVILKTDDTTITSLMDDTDFSVCYAPGTDGLTCHPITKGSIKVFGKTGASQVYSAPPKVGAYTFNGQAPQPPVCFHEQEYKDWLSQMRNGETVEALGALVDTWYHNPCPDSETSQTTTATMPPMSETGIPEAGTPASTPFSARILNIHIDAEDRYVVEYETYGYTEEMPGMHIHFFFNTVPPEKADVEGSGTWVFYGGPRPFTQFTVTDRPQDATQLCILVATEQHKVIQQSGNCVDLPPSPVDGNAPETSTAATPAFTENPGSNAESAGTFPTVTVNQQANCRYGPNVAYLHAADLSIGDTGTAHGVYNRVLSKWLYVKFDKLDRFCWVAPSVVDVVGDVNTLKYTEIALPGPISYEPPRGVNAVRDGNKVTIRWKAIPNTGIGDQGYFLDLFVCQGDGYFWYPVAIDNREKTSYTIKDEKGCPVASVGKLYAVDQRGYTNPVKISWPLP